MNNQGSKESLYANINRGNNVASGKTDINQQSSSTHNLSNNSNVLNRSVQNLNTPHVSTLSSVNITDTHNVIENHTSPVSNKHNLSGGSSFADVTGNLSNETYTEISTSSNTSSTKSKKRKWGILMGRSKSSEKVKSATLGREKKEKDKNETNNRHRWSTGLHKFNPLPPSISKEAMCQLLENKLADSQLFFEFDKIPKKKQNAEFTSAMHPDNSAFNRFKDVLPYEDNRLRLTPTKNNQFGYINASQITATVGSKQRFYIAAQGPTRQTLPYFWQCVWEAEVYLMVQLTEPTEDITYLPDADER